MAASDLVSADQFGFSLDFLDNSSAVKLTTPAETVADETDALVIDFLVNQYVWKASPPPFANIYPEEFPAPLIESFSATVNMGVIRADTGVHQSQRRVFTTMPHTFSMAFAVDLIQWAEWQQWVTTNGYRWFQINLPTMYAGQTGERLAPTIIRIVSPITAAAYSQHQVQLSVIAETAPSMIRNLLGSLDV